VRKSKIFNTWSNQSANLKLTHNGVDLSHSGAIYSQAIILAILMIKVLVAELTVAVITVLGAGLIAGINGRCLAIGRQLFLHAILQHITELKYHLNL